jgi:solute carrier family 25 (mitochondrial phosphate transporter), member 23/24/25/41
MVRAEGVAGCFKGNWTNCVRIIPNSAVKFLLYEQAVRSLSHASLDAGGDGRLGPFARLGAGAAAGIVAMSATYPLDMVRGRLTVQGGAGGGGGGGGGAAPSPPPSAVPGGPAPSTTTTPQYRGIAHAARTIAREEGLVALWRGWLPSVIGVIPYVGLNFCVYETLKDGVLRWQGLDDERQIPVATRLGCGAVAGTTGQTIAFPLDVVRRRMQMSGWAGAAALHGADAAHSRAVAYTGMTDCFVRTVREEGVRALFKGLWPNYIKVVPSIAIAFVSYEQLKEAMGVQLRISS